MTSGKENNIRELNGKLLKWTQKLVLKFLAAVKREKRNYQYLMTGNRKGLPLQDSFLICFPATSFPPTIATALRQRSWSTPLSHFLHLSPASPACNALCPSPVSLILNSQAAGKLALTQDRAKSSSSLWEQHVLPTNTSLIALHYICFIVCFLHWAECILIHLNEWI